MTDLQRILRDGDPAGDPAERLTPEQAAEIRRRMLTTPVRTDAVRTAPWHQPLALAFVVALTLAAGVLAGLRFVAPRAESTPPAEYVPAEAPRQFQFSTPGGTRIIWVFDPEFQVKESLP